MMLNQQLLTKTRTPNRKELTSVKVAHDYVFTRWMGSWEPRLSLWSTRSYSDALLAYIGKIYGQQANVYHCFNTLWNESLYKTIDELDLLNILIERVSKIPGAKASLHKRQETSRIESRFNELKSIFDKNYNSRFKLSSKLYNNELINKESIDSYFDLGCGNGLITARIGNHFNIKKENIYGGDVFNSNNEQITHVSIDQNQSIIDLSDQSVSLITCLVTLHHIENIDNMLNELARIIKPNGYLLIREHDCKLERSVLTKYLHFIHGIMIIGRIGEFSNDYVAHKNEKLTWVEQKKKIVTYTKSIQYKTRQEWQNRLELVGFDLLAIFDYDLNKTTNPQRLFYGLYKRNEKIN
ncbi:unnamed protein product [Rotaria magnacalcarata]|uniref:Methyltransferase type 11 domain-containing protein n=3 Tax=Rotaria magnacalcarata TaxID=392030 RepID=A0A816D376_9BILA|nr:unnamed protein product [Rotaria magnacalcarata]CAF2161646.1 unnamed protein product [Rotaria magnacalcarata]CAF3900018.1 unnamed protein product [Rotaria magnacalcarata]CAF3935519.1 unnamed protein product [Rotaria magnacalcarata]CAF3985502.1 unnamed protein product [Rotaria magnacalcarata]